MRCEWSKRSRVAGFSSVMGNEEQMRASFNTSTSCSVGQSSSQFLLSIHFALDYPINLDYSANQVSFSSSAYRVMFWWLMATQGRAMQCTRHKRVVMNVNVNRAVTIHAEFCWLFNVRLSWHQPACTCKTHAELTSTGAYMSTCVNFTSAVSTLLTHIVFFVLTVTVFLCNSVFCCCDDSTKMSLKIGTRLSAEFANDGLGKFVTAGALCSVNCTTFSVWKRRRLHVMRRRKRLASLILFFPRLFFCLRFIFLNCSLIC